MSNTHHTPLGHHDMMFGTNVPFFISDADRRQHLYAIGRTGTGKSTLLLNLFADDVARGRGVALIDPHGDLAQAALALVPAERTHSVIYLNPSDLEHPIGLNILENVPFDLRAPLTSSIVATFRSLWGHSWGPRLERLLYNSIALLLDHQGTTLVSMVRLLDDPTYRDRLVAGAKDPLVQRFWREQFPKLIADIGAELDQPVQNKVEAFLGAPALRNIIGQPRSTFSVRHMMDKGQILIVNLSKGLLGEIHSQLLGALLVNTIGHTALSRADTAEHNRRDFFLLIDEFQNFTSTDAFASLLSEARKYRLNMTLANQFLEQLPDPTRAAILGNVGSMIVYRVSAGDAKILAPELDLERDMQSLTILDRGETRCRLLDNSQTQNTIFGRMLPPPIPLAHQLHLPDHQARVDRHVANVINESRTRFTTPRSIVEDKITRFLQSKAV